MSSDVPRAADNALPIIDRNPEWRMVWDELAKSQQKEIDRAVRRGEAMDDAGHAAVAAGAAIRAQRVLTIYSLVFFIGGAAMTWWLWSIKPQEPPASYWIALFTGLIWFIVAPASALFRRHRAARAERANRGVGMNAGGE